MFQTSSILFGYPFASATKQLQEIDTHTHTTKKTTRHIPRAVAVISRVVVTQPELLMTYGNALTAATRCSV